MPDIVIVPDAAAEAAAATQAAEQAAALAAAGPTEAEKAATAAAEAAKVVAPVVPEKYELKLPDGSKVDPAIVERTAATARALGLSNEAGQKLLDSTVEDIAAQEEARTAAIDAWKPGGTEFVKRDEAWRAAALADPDIGGTPEKLAVSVEKGQQALAKFGPELKTYLDETGLGSHPAALKFLSRIGHAMSEGVVVHGNSSNGNRQKTTAEVMYPSLYNDDGSPKT